MFWHAAPSRKFVDLSECPNTRKETSLSRSSVERVDCALKRAFGSDDYAELFRARKDRKSVVSGQSVSVRVDLGGRRIIKNLTNQQNQSTTHDDTYHKQSSLTNS